MASINEQSNAARGCDRWRAIYIPPLVVGPGLSNGVIRDAQTLSMHGDAKTWPRYGEGAMLSGDRPSKAVRFRVPLSAGIVACQETRFGRFKIAFSRQLTFDHCLADV